MNTTGTRPSDNGAPAGGVFRARSIRARALAGFLTGAVGLFLAHAPLHANDWAPNLTTFATWHDNASNAEATVDQIDSLEFGADILASQRYSLGRDDAVQLTGHFAGEWWPRYRGLLSGAAGARAAWLHTFGVGLTAPVFTAEIGGDYVEANEGGRSGTAASLSFSLRKRFDDRWRAVLTQQFDRHYARAAVFDVEATQTTLELSNDITEVSRLVASVHYRDGDVVTYSGNPRGEVAAIASAEREVDTFDRPMTVYSVNARTWGAKFSLVRALDESTAIIASYAWRGTEGNPVQFTNHRASISLVTQF